MELYNKRSREELKRSLAEETFNRKTISFYRYFPIHNPQIFRDEVYQEWNELQCLGRIYIAREGINAQMSVPEHHWSNFLTRIHKREIFREMPIKFAVEDNGKSFYKFTVKVRSRLVADGLPDGAFDVSNVGKHMSALEFHEFSMRDDVVLVDMRNHYESEIGHFKNAICPQSDTFREEIGEVHRLLQDKKKQKILLYCTGGIRCEKASAYLRHHGFEDVNQLHGGILEYVRQIKKHGMESNFIGKNFVFDERLGERISDHIIARCHQCGNPCDTHVNCSNELCHLLFLQCNECKNIYEGCCSVECRSAKSGTEEDRNRFTELFERRFGNRKIFRKGKSSSQFICSNQAEYSDIFDAEPGVR